MRLRFGLFVVFISLMPVLGFSQQTDTLLHKLDSLGKKEDSLGNGKNNNIDQSNYNERTRLNGRTYPILLWSNFKQQVTLPFHAKKQDWKKFGAFVLVTGAVALSDETINKFAVDLSKHNKGVRDISKHVTNFGGLWEGYTLATLGAYGIIFKNEKIKTTTLLATQAYITAGAIEAFGKIIFGRQRPNYYDPITGESDPTFHGPFFQFKKNENGQKKYPNQAYTSFPSGHSTVAFAAATVFAMEYRDRPLVPIIAYSAASLVALSRLTENKHWPTDILVGAALGFLSGKQVVNNYHRYAKIQNDKLRQEKQKKTSVSLNLQYWNGTVMPGLTYHF